MFKITYIPDELGIISAKHEYGDEDIDILDAALGTTHVNVQIEKDGVSHFKKMSDNDGMVWLVPSIAYSLISLTPADPEYVTLLYESETALSITLKDNTKVIITNYFWVDIEKDIREVIESVEIDKSSYYYEVVKATRKILDEILKLWPDSKDVPVIRNISNILEKAGKLERLWNVK